MIYRVSLVFRLVMPNNVDFVAILVDPFWFELLLLLLLIHTFSVLSLQLKKLR